MQSTPVPSPLGLFWKSVLFYVVLVLVMRVMGKREIASLSPLDLVVTIMIADAAIIAIEEDRFPVWVGLIPVATIAGAEISLSWLMMKSMRLRAWVAGKPSVVVAHGRVVEKELRGMRYNLDELLSQLRQCNIANVADVEFAVLEPTGKLSVIPYADKRPVQPADLGLSPQSSGLPVNLIVDGVVDDEILKELNKSREWLDAQLAAQGIPGPAEVFLCSLDGQGTLFIQTKDRFRAREGAGAKPKG